MFNSMNGSRYRSENQTKNGMHEHTIVLFGSITSIENKAVLFVYSFYRNPNLMRALM